MNLIGLSGHAGVGKDTGADHLVRRHGYVSMSLADEMKRICKRVYDFSDEQLWGPSAMRNAVDPRYPRDLETPGFGGYLSPRVALQKLGTEWGRDNYVNTWIDALLRDARAVLAGTHYYTKPGGLAVRMRVPSDAQIASGDAPSGVVVPDCRFQNEIDAIHAAGGYVFRLRRDTGGGSVGIAGHRSEAEMDGIPDSAFDAVIDVEDGVENYQRQVDSRIAGFVAASELAKASR